MIKGETDKRINIYRIWDGKQLILCKNSNKARTRVNNKDWVVLFPTISVNDEKRMMYEEHATQNTDFDLSDAGVQYLRTIWNEPREISYIAEVEYIPINGRSRRLWDELKKMHEFELWNIDNGPLKYFRKKDRQFIAIYKVFSMPFSINRKKDQVPDINGNEKRKKQLTPEISEKIFRSISQFKPIVDEDEFQKRRETILKLIRETRNDIPDRIIPKKINNELNKDYEPTNTTDFVNQTSEIKINNETNNKLIKSENILSKTDNEQTKKYCIFCGTELLTIAIYCSNCGKKQINP